MSDADELLRLEYEYASRLLGSLTEIRFKLLALVPTLTGAVVALVSAGSSGVELLAIGGLGLAATSGVLAYELRNGELRRRATVRVNQLEAKLFPGGPWSARRAALRGSSVSSPPPTAWASGSSTALLSADGSTSSSGARWSPPARGRTRRRSGWRSGRSSRSRSSGRWSSRSGPTRGRRLPLLRRLAEEVEQRTGDELWLA